MCFFCFKQKTAYEMRISDWSSDVCSSDLRRHPGGAEGALTTTKESPMHRQVPDSDLEYELVSFDKHGKEREESGALPSDALTARLAQRDAPVTDMFLLSHGWKDRKSTRLNSSH